MKADPVICREIPVIKRIIADETWLEGERRGCCVSPDDPIVIAKVCEVVLRVGQQMRKDAESKTNANISTIC